MSPRAPSRAATFALVGSLAGALAGACAEPPPRELVLHAGLLVDGTGGPPRLRQRLLIQDGVLTAIEDDAAAAPEVSSAIRAVVDARDATVMPGMVDVGYALFPEAACGLPDRSLENAVESSLLALAAGITSAVALDTARAPLVSLRRVVGTARHRGPRLFAAGEGIEISATPAGALVFPKSRLLPVGNAVAAAAAVETDAALDADVLHVRVGPMTTPSHEEALVTSLCATLEAGRRHELRTIVSVQDDAGLAAAARCKAHAVASTAVEPPSEASLRLARDNDTTLVVHPGSHGLPLLVASGARLAVATGLDTCEAPRRRLEATLARMGERGVPPASIVVAATHGGASVLGLGEVLGRVTTGFRGDLIVVDGDPTRDPAALTRVRHVIVDGVVQRPDRTRRALVALAAWLRVLWDA